MTKYRDASDVYKPCLPRCPIDAALSKEEDKIRKQLGELGNAKVVADNILPWIRWFFLKGATQPSLCGVPDAVKVRAAVKDFRRAAKTFVDGVAALHVRAIRGEDT